MARLVKTTNVYEDDKGRFETNMVLELIIDRPDKERKYHFKDAYDNSVVLDEAQPYENGKNYVKWLPNTGDPIAKGVIDEKQIKIIAQCPEILAEIYNDMTDAEKDEFLRLTGNN